MLDVTGTGRITYGTDGGVLQNGANNCIDCDGCPDGEPLHSNACVEDPFCPSHVLGEQGYPAYCIQLQDPWDPNSPPDYTIGDITQGSFDKFPPCATPLPDPLTGPCYDATATFPAEANQPVGALRLPAGHYGGTGIEIRSGARVIFHCPNAASGCLFMGQELNVRGGAILANGVTFYATPGGGETYNANGTEVLTGIKFTGNAGNPAVNTLLSKLAERSREGC